MEENDFQIESENYYKGSDVRILIDQIIQIANEEIEKTTLEASKKIAIELQIQIDLLKEDIEKNKNKTFFNNLKIGIITGSACLVIGTIAGMFLYKELIK